LTRVAAPAPAAARARGTVALTGLVKRYGATLALDGVSLTIAPGEFFTLLGPSGCGKTTTLRSVAGFVAPDAGEVAIDGVTVTRVPPHRRQVGMVFQHYALFPHRTVAQNVGFGLRMQRVDRAEIERKVKEALALVHLPGHGGRYPGQLSGGEQQRVALARAIVIRPRLLLFDEPLSNLDARLRVQMRDEIRDLQQRLAITTIYVTHDQEEAMAVSDRIVVMSAGRIVQVGSAEDLYHRPRTRFVAEFIGRVNLIAARVTDVEGDRVALDALGRRFVVHHDGAPLHAGDAACLVLRPEALEIVRADDPRAALQGVVTARAFLGEKVEYRVACGEASLQAIRYNSGPADLVPPGLAIGLAVAADGAVAVPERDA